MIYFSMCTKFLFFTSPICGYIFNLTLGDFALSFPLDRIETNASSLHLVFSPLMRTMGRELDVIKSLQVRKIK